MSVCLGPSTHQLAIDGKNCVQCAVRLGRDHNEFVAGTTLDRKHLQQQTLMIKRKDKQKSRNQSSSKTSRNQSRPRGKRKHKLYLFVQLYHLGETRLLRVDSSNNDTLF